MDDLEHKLVRSPNNFVGYGILAEAYLQDNKIQQAKEQIAYLLQQKANDVGGLLGQGHLDELSGDIEGARASYKATLTAPRYVEDDLLQDFIDLAQARPAALPAETHAPAQPAPVIVSVAPEKPAKPTFPADPIQLTAYKMVDTHCARWHQTDKTTGLSKAQSKVANILDLQALATDKRWVTPGLPLKSSLYFTVLRREMPYDVFQDGDIDKPLPSDAEADALKAWIASLSPAQTVAARAASRR